MNTNKYNLPPFIAEIIIFKIIWKDFAGRIEVYIAIQKEPKEKRSIFDKNARETLEKRLYYWETLEKRY